MNNNFEIQEVFTIADVAREMGFDSITEMVMFTKLEAASAAMSLISDILKPLIKDAPHVSLAELDDDDDDEDE